MTSVIPQKRRSSVDDGEDNDNDNDVGEPVAITQTSNLHDQHDRGDGNDDHDDRLPRPPTVSPLSDNGYGGVGGDLKPGGHGDGGGEEEDGLGPDAQLRKDLDGVGSVGAQTPLESQQQEQQQEQQQGSPANAAVTATAIATAPPAKATAATRTLSARAKKETLKKRESLAADLARDKERERERDKARAKEKERDKEKDRDGESAKARDNKDKDKDHGPKDARAAKKGAPDGPRPEELAPLRYVLGAPKRADFEPPRGPVFSFHHGVTAPDGMPIEFYETSEHVHNKRNFRYTHCIADPTLPNSMYYRHTEPEPHGPHMSFEDSAAHVYFDRTAHHVTTDKGFRTARSNVCIREGRWFWECRVTRGIPRQLRKDSAGGGDSSAGMAMASTGGGGGGGGGVGGSTTTTTNSNNNPTTTNTSSGVKVAPTEARGHVRIGFTRREASLDAPVGFDAYGYGIRDVAGQRIHLSRPRDFFPPGEDLREGDVLGLEIQLPAEQLQRKVLLGSYNPAVDAADTEPDIFADDAGAPNIVRDRIPIRFKSTLYFEKIDYHPTKDLEDLCSPDSSSSSSLSRHEPPHPLHHVPALRTLPNSFIRVYKNGAPMGTAFEGLLAFLPPASQPQAQPGARQGLDDGMLGYYPAVSVFRGGAAEVNFGPRFWYPPPEYEEADDEVDMVDVVDMLGGGACPPPSTSPPNNNNNNKPNKKRNTTTTPSSSTSDFFSKIRPVSQRFAEQIAEDVYYDMLDEVDFWARDGMPADDGAADRERRRATAAADQVPREGVDEGAGEIKQLIQDD